MKNKTILFLVVIKIILAIAIVSADMIPPGFRGISIENYIENIEDFPDYVFISGGSINTGICPLKIIDGSGEIEGYYKHCSVFVYAIPEDKINETEIQEINFKRDMGAEEVKAYFESLGGKEVIEPVRTYTKVSVVSSLKGIKNYYKVSLNEIQDEPTRVVKVKSGIIYLYIIVPIIAILIIIWIIFKKKE